MYKTVNFYRMKTEERLTILITGDFCPHLRIEKLVKDGNIKNIYGDLLNILLQKDLSITNLECPLTKSKSKIYKNGPHLKADPLSVKALEAASFDIVTLANNHILDFGNIGLTDTIKTCENAGIKTIGAGTNLNSASAKSTHLIKGKVITILNFTENEFSIAANHSSGANPYNVIKILQDIKQAKNNGEIVILILHGGNEHYPLPNPRIVETYRKFAKAGANVIVGHHPHCNSGYEEYENTPIFYSLGNFIFDSSKDRYPEFYYGFFVELSFNCENSPKFKIHPYIQCKDAPGIRRMNKTEYNSFNSSVKTLSAIIKDEKKLEESWNQFCSSQKMNYMQNLFSLNKFKRFLLKSGIPLKHIVNKKKLLKVYNYINCEAHRDAILNILKNEFS